MADPYFNYGSDWVYFRALISEKRKDNGGQNIGFSEDYLPKIYSHSIGTQGAILVDIDLVAKFGDAWATDYKFTDLRDFIRLSINYGQNKFTYNDGKGGAYDVRMYPNSWTYHRIPGTSNLWLVSLKIYIVED